MPSHMHRMQPSAKNRVCVCGRRSGCSKLNTSSKQHNSHFYWQQAEDVAVAKANCQSAGHFSVTLPASGLSRMEPHGPTHAGSVLLLASQAQAHPSLQSRLGALGDSQTRHCQTQTVAPQQQTPTQCVQRLWQIAIALGLWKGHDTSGTISHYQSKALVPCP